MKEISCTGCKRQEDATERPVYRRWDGGHSREGVGIDRRRESMRLKMRQEPGSRAISRPWGLCPHVMGSHVGPHRPGFACLLIKPQKRKTS